MNAIEQNTTPPRAESTRNPESAPSGPGGLRSRAPDLADASAGAVAATRPPEGATQASGEPRETRDHG